MEPTERRNGYLTTAQHQMDERLLVLRGGRLDGRTRSLVTRAGQRVFCGDGDWTVEDVYLVTTETVEVDGQEATVCVPAFA